MELLGVQTDNPTWAMDGMSLLPYLGENTSMVRPKPLGFSWGGAHVIIDNEWKLMNKPVIGQCAGQEPYFGDREGQLDSFYLFNVVDDYHELHDQKAAQPQRFLTMQAQLTEFLASIANSQANETQCKGRSPAPPPPPPGPPLPPAPPSTRCNFTQHAGLSCKNYRKDTSAKTFRARNLLLVHSRS